MMKRKTAAAVLVLALAASGCFEVSSCRKMDDGSYRFLERNSHGNVVRSFYDLTAEECGLISDGMPYAEMLERRSG